MHMVKRIKKSVFVLVLMILINVILLMILKQISYPSINKVNLNNYGNEKKEYFLSPLNNSALISKSEVGYPFIKISPIEKIYPLMNLLEIIDLKTKKYDELFFAAKRISELAQWKNDLDWNNALHRYEILINSYISYIVSIDKTSDMAAKQLRQTLLSHRIFLEKILFTSSKSDEERNAIETVISTIFDHFNSKLKKYSPDYNPFNLKYSLNDIVKEKEYGVYDVTVDFQNEGFFQNMPQLKVGSNIYSGTVDKELDLLIFKNVLFEPLHNPKNNLDYISLSFQEKNVIEDTSFQEDTSSTTPYTYYLETRNLDKGQYIVKLNHRFENPFTFQLAQNYQDQNKQYTENTINSDYVINETVYPHNDNPITYIKFKVKDSNHKIISTRFLITTQNPIPKETLSNLKIELYPLFEPDMSVVKIFSLPGFAPAVNYQQINKNQYLITAKNTSTNQEKYIYHSLGFGWKIDNRGIATYWLSEFIFKLWLLSCIAILFIIYYLLFKPNWFHALFLNITFFGNALRLVSRTIQGPFQYIGGGIHKILLKYRLFLVITTIIGFILDIIITRQNSNFIIFFLTFFWIMILIVYRLESKINFVFALSFLAFCTILLIFRLDGLAEKSAIWAYLMLVVGTVHAAVEKKVKPQKLMKSQDFLKLFGDDWLINELSQAKKKIIADIRKAEVLLYNLIYKFLKFIFIRRPKTLREYFVFIAKIIASVFLIAIFVRSLVNFIISTNNKINAENRKKYRLSLNPKILDIQPKIVYRSTKVIIYGQYFGWKQNDKVRLLRDGKEVVTDLWTDSKIIFTVPLHWETAYTNLWVEKAVPWEGHTIVVKSEIVNIKVIQVRTPYTYEDDQFFEQLKNLNKEALEINGYK